MHKSDWDEKDVDGFTIGGEAPKATSKKDDANGVADEGEDEKKQEDNNDDVEVIHENDAPVESSSSNNIKKRIAEESNGKARSKKSRVEILVVEG